MTFYIKADKAQIQELLAAVPTASIDERFSKNSVNIDVANEDADELVNWCEGEDISCELV